LTLLLIGKENLANRFDKELGTAHETYKSVIQKQLLEIISLLQMVKQGRDADFVETADEILNSLQEVKNKHGL
jgi:hypothetical protein